MKVFPKVAEVSMDAPENASRLMNDDEIVVAQVTEPLVEESRTAHDANPYWSQRWADSNPSWSGEVSPVGHEADTVTSTASGRFALPHIGYSVLWVIVLMMMQALVGMAVGFLAIAFYMAKHGTALSSEILQSINKEIMIYLLPAGTLTTLLTAVGASRIMLGRNTWRELRMRWVSLPELVLVLLLVVPLQVLACEVTNIMAELVPSLNGETFADIAQQPWAIVVFVMCVLPGVGEEIFFRGFIGRGLIARHGRVMGVLLTSLLFGLVHVDPVQASGAFVLGIALHWIFLTTKSLVAPIIVHILNNTLAFALMRYGEIVPITGLTVAEENGPGHIGLPILGAAAIAVSILCTALWLVRSNGEQVSHLAADA